MRNASTKQDFRRLIQLVLQNCHGNILEMIQKKSAFELLLNYATTNIRKAKAGHVQMNQNLLQNQQGQGNIKKYTCPPVVVGMTDIEAMST